MCLVVVDRPVAHAQEAQDGTSLRCFKRSVIAIANGLIGGGIGLAVGPYGASALTLKTIALITGGATLGPVGAIAALAAVALEGVAGGYYGFEVGFTIGLFV